MRESRGKSPPPSGLCADQTAERGEAIELEVPLVTKGNLIFAMKRCWLFRGKDVAVATQELGSEELIVRRHSPEPSSPALDRRPIIPTPSKRQKERWIGLRMSRV
jgi:hypothetical protein